MWGFLEKKAILLADRGFCSYYALARLKEQSVDSVIRFHQSRNSDRTKGKKLAPNDRLQTWTKPLKPPDGLREEEFEKVPNEPQVRVVEIQCSAKSFRCQSCLLVTTLLDTETYPAEALGVHHLTNPRKSIGRMSPEETAPAKSQGNISKRP